MCVCLLVEEQRRRGLLPPRGMLRCNLGGVPRYVALLLKDVDVAGLSLGPFIAPSLLHPPSGRRPVPAQSTAMFHRRRLFLSFFQASSVGLC